MLNIQHRDELPLLLNQLNLTGIGAEIGVWDGTFSNTIISKSNLNLLFSIDAWDKKFIKVNFDQQAIDEHHLKCLSKLSKHKDRSCCIRLESQKAASLLFKDHSLDFIYIDATHIYDAVKLDIELWWPKLKYNGLFSGHDYASIKNWGVVEAVNEHAVKYKLDLYLTKEELPSWYCLKSLKI